MEMSIVNLVGTPVAGTRVSLRSTTTLDGALRLRASRAVTGAAPEGRGFGFGTTGIRLPLTTDPTLDVTSLPTG